MNSLNAGIADGDMPLSIIRLSCSSLLSLNTCGKENAVILSVAPIAKGLVVSFDFVCSTVKSHRVIP
jgi:hypothetical protein